jgi:hypothetical protein
VGLTASRSCHGPFVSIWGEGGFKQDGCSQLIAMFSPRGEWVQVAILTLISRLLLSRRWDSGFKRSLMSSAIAGFHPCTGWEWVQAKSSRLSENSGGAFVFDWDGGVGSSYIAEIFRRLDLSSVSVWDGSGFKPRSLGPTDVINGSSSHRGMEEGSSRYSVSEFLWTSISVWDGGGFKRRHVSSRQYVPPYGGWVQARSAVCRAKTRAGGF